MSIKSIPWTKQEIYDHMNPTVTKKQRKEAKRQLKIEDKRREAERKVQKKIEAREEAEHNANEAKKQLRREAERLEAERLEAKKQKKHLKKLKKNAYRIKKTRAFMVEINTIRALHGHTLVHYSSFFTVYGNLVPALKRHKDSKNRQRFHDMMMLSAHRAKWEDTLHDYCNNRAEVDYDEIMDVMLVNRTKPNIKPYLRFITKKSHPKKWSKFIILTSTEQANQRTEAINSKGTRIQTTCAVDSPVNCK